MEESSRRQQLPGGGDDDTGAVDRVRSLARRGRRRLSGLVRSRARRMGDRLADKLLELLSSPQQVERLQTALVNVANWSLDRGFRSDPNAELLFEFVDWLEQRHDRRTITTILLRSSVVTDPEFLDALAHLTQALGPFSTTEGAPGWDEQQLNRFKQRAGDRLLDLLVHLAALEADRPPAAGSAERRLDYFDSAPIPVRFRRLGPMTRGQQLLERDPVASHSKWTRRLARHLPGVDADDTRLQKYVPGVGDDELYFLVFSTAFFFQSYLLRNLIEALPDMAEEIRRQLESDEMIDVD